MPTKPWKRRVGRVTVYTRGRQCWIYYRDGQVIRKPVGENRNDALRLASRINAELSDGAPTSLGYEPLELGELIRRWLAHHEHVRRSSVATLNRYRTAAEHVVRFVESRATRTRTDTFLAPVAEAFVRYLRTVKVSPNGHPNTTRRRMSDKGVKYVLGVCRSLFSYAREHRHVAPYAPNPFSKLGIERMAVEDAKPTTPMTKPQLSEFLAACDDYQRPLFVVLAYTGVRVGELTHLLIDRDIDWGNKLIRVTSKPALCWLVKTRSEREIPMVPDVEQAIRETIGSRTTGPVFLRRRFAGGDDVPQLSGKTLAQLEAVHRARCEVSSSRIEVARLAKHIWRDAGVIRESRVRTEYMKVARCVGMGEFTCPKALRHYFATALLAAGVDPIIRRDLMGHTTLEMTDHYTHANSEERRAQLARAALAQP